jgi:hypothetical protein
MKDNISSLLDAPSLLPAFFPPFLVPSPYLQACGGAEGMSQASGPCGTQRSGSAWSERREIPPRPARALNQLIHFPTCLSTAIPPSASGRFRTASPGSSKQYFAMQSRQSDFVLILPAINGFWRNRFSDTMILKDNRFPTD